MLRNDSDPDPHTTLTVSRATAPRAANGRVKLTAKGVLQYRPNEDFVGTDTFGYEISDGALTDRGRVTITVGP